MVQVYTKAVLVECWSICTLFILGNYLQIPLGRTVDQRLSPAYLVLHGGVFVVNGHVLFNTLVTLVGNVRILANRFSSYLTVPSRPAINFYGIHYSTTEYKDRECPV